MCECVKALDMLHISLCVTVCGGKILYHLLGYLAATDITTLLSLTCTYEFVNQVCSHLVKVTILRVKCWLDNTREMDNTPQLAP